MSKFHQRPLWTRQNLQYSKAQKLIEIAIVQFLKSKANRDSKIIVLHSVIFTVKLYLKYKLMELVKLLKLATSPKLVRLLPWTPSRLPYRRGRGRTQDNNTVNATWQRIHCQLRLWWNACDPKANLINQETVGNVSSLKFCSVICTFSAVI